MSKFETFVETFLNVSIAASTFPAMLEAAWLTIYLSFFIVLTGVAAGLALALLRSSGLKVVVLPIILFADLFRTIPPLVLICLFYFGLPNAGISMNGLTSAWAALALILTAYAEECFWAGISSINKGQWEAARSSGLTGLQTLIYVILPQAAKISVAPLTSRVIAISKSTSYASVVAVGELLGVAQSTLTYTYNATPLVIAAIGYCIIFIPVVVLGQILERQFQWKRS